MFNNKQKDNKSTIQQPTRWLMIKTFPQFTPLNKTT